MKTTKILVLCNAVLALWATGLKADDNSNGTIQSSVLSKYVDIDGQVYYDKPVIQTEATVSIGSKGFYLDLWDSQTLDGSANYGDEIETSLGWSHDGRVSVDVGISYYDILPLFHGPAGDFYVAYAKLSKAFDKGDKGTLTPFLSLTTYTSGRASDHDGGVRAQGGLTYSKTAGKVTFESTTAIVRDDGTFGALPAWVGSQSIDLAWKVGKARVKLPTATGYAPLSGHSGRRSTIVYGANISFDF